MSLAPCPSCSRHVRRTERACPFCGSAIALDGAPIAQPPFVRLGRAAIFTFGAAVAAGAPGCSTYALYGAPAIDTGVAQDAAPSNDAGDDAGVVAHYGGPPIDANVDMGGSSSDYGAPPPIDAGTGNG
jgi:hypothetical protein